MRSSVLLACGVAGALTVLNSFSSGISGAHDATGSPLSTIQCGSCHNGGNFGTDTQVRLVDANGTMQSSYIPGETYTLQVEIATTTAPSAYGFQAVVLDGANAQAGRFGTPASGIRVRARNGIEYIDHTRRLQTNLIEIDWTAPAMGTGQVDVYAVGNAINGNGGTSGDLPDTGTLSLAEGMAPPTFTQRTLAELRVVDAQGIPSLLGEAVEVEGIVYGFDTEPGVSNFNLLNADNSAGLTVLNYSDSLGYTATEGDRVRLRGVLEQVVGLTYLSAVQVEVLSQNTSLPGAMNVDALDETLENVLVEFDSLTLVAGQWQDNPTATYDVKWLRPNGDTLITQIAQGMPVWGESRPGDGERLYTVTGVVRQFDLDQPFLEGYYLLPRYTSDFVEEMPSSTRRVSAAELRVTRFGESLEVRADQAIAAVTLFSIDGRVLERIPVSGTSTFVKTNKLPTVAGLIVVNVQFADGRVGAVLR